MGIEECMCWYNIPCIQRHIDEVRYREGAGGTLC